MLTWDEIRDHLRATFRLVVVEDDHVSLRWLFDGAHEVQTARARLVSAFERPWLLVTADVAAAIEVEPGALATHNAEMAFGALAYDGMRCVARLALPLDGLTLALVATVVEGVAYAAAQARAELQRRGHVDLFLAYVD